MNVEHDDSLAALIDMAVAHGPVTIRAERREHNVVVHLDVSTVVFGASFNAPAESTLIRAVLASLKRRIENAKP